MSDADTEAQVQRLVDRMMGRREPTAGESLRGLVLLVLLAPPCLLLWGWSLQTAWRWLAPWPYPPVPTLAGILLVIGAMKSSGNTEGLTRGKVVGTVVRKAIMSALTALVLLLVAWLIFLVAV